MILIALSQDKECIYQSQQYFNDTEKEKIKNSMYDSLSYLEPYELIEITDYEFETLINEKQIDNCPPKTTEEKVEDLISQVTVMDEIIANLTLEVL